MWIVISKFQAEATALALAVAFVASLYLWGAQWSAVDRDDPRVIARRMISIAIVTVLSPLCTYFWAVGGVQSSDSAAKLRPSEFWKDLPPEGPGLAGLIGLWSEGWVLAVVLPVLLVSILFAGPLAELAFEWWDTRSTRAPGGAAASDAGAGGAQGATLSAVLQHARASLRTLPSAAAVFFGKGLRESVDVAADSFARDHHVAEAPAAAPKVAPSFSHSPSAQLSHAEALRAHAAKAGLRPIDVAQRHLGPMRLRTLVIAPVA